MDPIDLFLHVLDAPDFYLDDSSYKSSWRFIQATDHKLEDSALTGLRQWLVVQRGLWSDASIADLLQERLQAKHPNTRINDRLRFDELECCLKSFKEMRARVGMRTIEGAYWSLDPQNTETNPNAPPPARDTLRDLSREMESSITRLKDWQVQSWPRIPAPGHHQDNGLTQPIPTLPPLGNEHIHEAMDRVHMASQHLHIALEHHPVINGHNHLREQYEHAADAIKTLYRMLNSITPQHS